MPRTRRKLHTALTASPRPFDASHPVLYCCCIISAPACVPVPPAVLLPRPAGLLDNLPMHVRGSSVGHEMLEAMDLGETLNARLHHRHYHQQHAVSFPSGPASGGLPSTPSSRAHPPALALPAALMRALMPPPAARPVQQQQQVPPLQQQCQQPATGAPDTDMSDAAGPWRGAATATVGGLDRTTPAPGPGSGLHQQCQRADGVVAPSPRAYAPQPFLPLRGSAPQQLCIASLFPALPQAPHRPDPQHKASSHCGPQHLQAGNSGESSGASAPGA